MLKKVKIIKRKIISMVMVIIMLSFSINVYANSSTLYTQQDLIQHYLENSFEIKVFDIERKLEKLDLTRKQDAVDSVEKTVNDTEEDYNDAKKSKSSHLQDKREAYYDAIISYEKEVLALNKLQYNIDHSEDNRVSKSNQLAYSFEQMINQYTSLIKQVDVSQMTCDYNQLLYQSAQLKYDLEMITKVDLDKSYVNYQESYLQLLSLQNSLNELEKQVLLYAGLEDSTFEFSFKELDSIEPVEISLQHLITSFFDNSYDKAYKDFELDATKTYISHLKEVIPEDYEDLIQEDLQYHQMVIQYDDWINATTISLNQAYYDYNDTMENFYIYKEKNDIATVQFEQTTLAYEAGKLSLTEYEAAKIQLALAQLDFYKAETGYYMSLKNILLILDGTL